MSDYRLRGSGLYVPAGSTTQLKERIAELELAQDDAGWLPLGAAGETLEFSRDFVSTITRLARLYYLKNPLVNRGVNVKAAYVFGRGVNITAKDEDINDVVQAFLDDHQNQTELTSHTARLAKERELQTDGNLFLVLVPHASTGHVRVYTIDVDQVTDIVTDPANRKAAWYYKREWIENETDLSTGRTTEKRRIAYYRDWRNKPDQERTEIGGNEVIAGQYIYHIKTGGFSNWKFGISEFYSAIDWSKAYKTFLENWSTIVAAYARFAFKITTQGGKSGVAAAKSKLATTVNTTTGENNPAPVTASNIIMQDGNNIEPIRTAGAQTSADDGRRLLLMVAATFGLPETFFGDVSVGTLATATSLDRPTELMLTDRQTQWSDIYHDIFEFVLFYAVKAPQGGLRTIADIGENEYGEETLEFDDNIDHHIDVDFPSIVRHSLQEQMTAITQAAAFIADPKILARMALTALDENDIDELLEQLYPEDGSALPAQGNQPPVDPNAPPSNQPPQPEDDLAAAAQDLRQAIETLRETLVYTGGRDYIDHKLVKLNGSAR